MPVKFSTTLPIRLPHKHLPPKHMAAYYKQLGVLLPLLGGICVVLPCQAADTTGRPPTLDPTYGQRATKVPSTVFIPKADAQWIWDPRVADKQTVGLRGAFTE